MRLQFTIAASFPARLRGLIGRERTWRVTGQVLLIAPCRSVHTLFMRGELDIAFVDACGRVLEVHRRVPPGRVLACRAATMVLERFSPATADEEPWLLPGQELLLRAAMAGVA